MNKHAKPIDIIDVTAFLAVSCEHLELDSACLYRAAHRVYAPANQQSPQAEGQHKSMNHYRDIARNLLIAVGMGAFLAGPVLADPECPVTGTGVTYHERHVKQMEQHHKQLHDALKLTAEQEAGWVKLTASEQPVAGATQTEDWSKLTAPERAEKMLELSKAHQERMTGHVAALKAFYDTLTAEQKKIFEDSHAGLRDGMHGKPMHHLPSPDKAPGKS